MLGADLLRSTRGRAISIRRWGLWANNPSLVATVEAIRRFGKNIQGIRVLSVGTGLERFAYLRKPGWLNKAWGLLTGWGRGRLVDLMMSLQSHVAGNMTTLLLRDRLLRLNFYDEGLPMDNPKSVQDLRARADALFTYKSEDIRQFLCVASRAHQR